MTPFSSSPASFDNYQIPQWFQDAKFGIWSHWGAQAVPRQGDWYARKMYLEGDRHYKHHLATYGHSSQHGFKDILPLWKAEKWQPEALMEQYVKAGAKYFVSMAVHHDNFDLWNSKHHGWNAMQMGPQRDVVGEWQAAARKFGLPFGVSEHLGASFSWWQTSHGADKDGPLAGVPYDGADPQFQDLYHPRNETVYDNKHNTWYATDAASAAEWDRRLRDLIDNYDLDLLYSDGGIPFSEVGRDLVAHFYNVNAARHGGRVEAVYNHKDMEKGDYFDAMGVQDMERGGMPGINPRVWQTDTSNSDWFYDENAKFKTTSQIIHSLADVVSKNGTMLLNLVQYADGSLPPQSQQFLNEMAAWIPVNGEAIYGTRPWKIFGEGPTVMESGHFKEDFPFTSQDIRFTTKDNDLYAITLGVPTQPVVIEALGAASAHLAQEPKAVSLLGSKDILEWKRTARGLEIQLPATLPCQHSLAFKISL